jgi:lysophospholipase
MDQTFEVVVQGSGGADGSGRDAEWPACLACAVVDKARARSGMTRRGVCETCFQRYCYVPEGRESVLAAEGALSGAASVAGRRVDKGGALGAMLAVACLVGVLMV